MKKIRKIVFVAVLSLLFTLALTACSAKVQKITVSQMPDKTQYMVGDEIETAGAKLTATMSKGGDKILSLSDEGVDYSPKVLTTASESVAITVSYKGKTTSFNVSVMSEVSYISVASLPTKTSGYIIGESINLNGGMITVSYENNDSETLPMTDSAFEVTPMVLTDGSVVNGNATITVKLKVKPAISTTFTLSGIEKLTATSLQLVSEPTKKDYEVTELLNLTGGQVKVNYNDSSKDGTFAMTDSRFKVSGFAGTPGVNIIKVEVVGQTDVSVTFNVTVDTTAVVDRIEIATEINKKTYYTGDSLDLRGGMVRIHYTLGNSSVSVLRDMGNSDIFKVEGFSSIIAATKVITVELKKMSDVENRVRKTFTVTVKFDSVTGMAKKTNPTKINYYKYEELELDGGLITLTYESKKVLDIAMNDTDYFTLYGDTNGQGSVMIYIFLNENTEKYIFFNISINNNFEESIEVTHEPEKKQYSTGERLDMNGGEIKLTYRYPTGNPVVKHYEMGSDYFRNNFTITGYNNTAGAAGNQTVMIALKSNVVSLSVKMFAQGITFTPRTITGIEILSYPSQYVYYTTESYSGSAPTAWNLAEGLVRLIYQPLSAGDTYEGVASMEDSIFEVSDINTQEDGVNVVTLKYGSCNPVKYPVMVYDMYTLYGMTYNTYLEMRSLARNKLADATYLLVNFNQITEMLERYIWDEADQTYAAAYAIFNENGITDKADYPYDFVGAMKYILSIQDYQDQDTQDAVCIMDFYKYILNFVDGTHIDDLYLSDASWWGIYGSLIKDDAEIEFLDYYLAAAATYKVNNLGEANIDDIKAGAYEGIAVLEKLVEMYLNLSPQQRYNFLSVVYSPNYCLYNNYTTVVMDINDIVFVNMIFAYADRLASDYNQVLLDGGLDKAAADAKSELYLDLIHAVLYASEAQAVVYECERLAKISRNIMQPVLEHYIDRLISLTDDISWTYLNSADTIASMDSSTLEKFGEFKQSYMDYVTESLFYQVYLYLVDVEKAYANMLYDPTEFIIAHQSYTIFVNALTADTDLGVLMPDVQGLLSNRDYPSAYMTIDGTGKYSEWIDKLGEYYGDQMAKEGGDPVAQAFISESIRLLTLLSPLGINADSTRETALNAIIAGTTVADGELEGVRQALTDLFNDFMTLNYSQKVTVFKFFDSKYGENINVEFFPYSKSLYALFSARFAIELKTSSAYDFSYENLLQLVLVAVERDAAFSQDEMFSGNRFAALDYIKLAFEKYGSCNIGVRTMFDNIMSTLTQIKSRLTQTALTGAVASISVESADLIVYQKGEELDKDLIYIKLTGVSGDAEVVRLSNSRFTVAGYNKATAGVQKLTITDTVSANTTSLLIYVFDYNALMNIAADAYDLYRNASSKTYEYAGDAAVLILLIKSLEDSIAYYYKDASYTYTSASAQELAVVKAAVIDLLENGSRLTDDYRKNISASSYLDYLRKAYKLRIDPYLGVMQKTDPNDINVTTWLSEIWADGYQYELTAVQEFFVYYVGIVVEYQNDTWQPSVALDLWNRFTALNDNDRYMFLNLLDTPGFEYKTFASDGTFDYSVLCNDTSNNVFSIIMSAYYYELKDAYGDYVGYAFSAMVYATEFYVLLKYWYLNNSDSANYQTYMDLYDEYFMNYIIKIDMEYIESGMNEEQIAVFQELFGTHYQSVKAGYVELIS